MKPAPFAYRRPDSLDEALALLAEHGSDAKPLAGGQSLVPAMNFRLAQPAVLIDLNRIGSLAGVEDAGDALRIGAMTRHRTLESDPRVAARAPLVAEATAWVAHPPIRARGTIGGSLAHADPAAELPAVCLALDATFTLRSTAGARVVGAADFFLGFYATALAPGELLTEVRLPAMPARSGWAIDELARRHGDYALAGAAAVVSLDETGCVAGARVALIGVHDRPVLAAHAAHALIGEVPSTAAIDAAADAAATRDADPSSDIHATVAYRRHLVRVLTRRTLTTAVARASAPLEASAG